MVESTKPKSKADSEWQELFDTVAYGAESEQDLKRVRRLVSAGADINANQDGNGLGYYTGHPLIYEAIIYGKAKLVKLLLELGAEFDFVLDNGCDLVCPLIEAARWNRHAILHELLRAKANPNITIHREYGTEDETPLSTALDDKYFFDLDTVIMLLEAGAKPDIEWVDTKRNTLLHYAVMAGNLDVVKTLVKAGSNTQLKNYKYKTPLMLAEEKGNTKIAKYLRTVK